MYKSSSRSSYRFALHLIKRYYLEVDETDVISSAESFQVVVLYCYVCAYSSIDRALDFGSIQDLIAEIEKIIMWYGGQHVRGLKLTNAHCWSKKRLARPAGLEPATT